MHAVGRVETEAGGYTEPNLHLRARSYSGSPAVESESLALEVGDKSGSGGANGCTAEGMDTLERTKDASAAAHLSAVEVMISDNETA